METWIWGLAASGTITVAFLAVAALLAVNLTRSRQWLANPLGAATFFLYLTCGGGHGVHTLLLLDPWLGIASASGVAARAVYSSWEMVLTDAVAALAGLFYWTQRKRYPDLVSGIAVFEDLRERERRALEIHDNVVQGIARAELAVRLERHEEGKAAMDDALAASRRIVADLAGREGSG